MSSAAVGSHSTGHLSLMSCVRESSPLQDYDCDIEKNVAQKKKFWNPKTWFRRRNKVADDVVEVLEAPGRGGDLEAGSKEALRSRSTSELSVAEDQTRRRSSTSMHQGLSQSHDSVFRSPNSGSDMGLDTARSTSSLSISQPHIDRVQTELSERLRLRRGRGDTSEDDEGLPRSPCNSPTTTDGLLDKTVNKDLPTKSHSTCSDGSLLSMGSSEMDEDSFGLHSRHSSKLSLHDKREVPPDSDLELSSTEPLNHSAAHHRVAVRPKRTHGAPRRKRGPQLSSALPAMPEINEESSLRSATPEIIIRETVTDFCSISTTQSENQMKCSSLPPGTLPPSDEAKLNRSKSNASSKSQDQLEEKEEKSDKSKFMRWLPRKSAKKKKSKDKSEDEGLPPTGLPAKPVAAPRSGPASRQRIIPIDIPASPEPEPRRLILPKASPSPDRLFGGTSPPFQAELENRFKQRQISVSSPPKSLDLPTTPSVITEQNYYKKSRHFESRQFETRETRKVKLPHLSPLATRMKSMSETILDDEEDRTSGFKSLTDFEIKPSKPVAKSQSFKNNYGFTSNNKIEEILEEREVSKAASLDSVQNFDEVETSELRFELKHPTIENKINLSETLNNVILKRQIEVKKEFELFEERTEEVEEPMSTITICGPSHTTTLNVTSQETTKSVMEEQEEDLSRNSIQIKESQVSITKIQMKRESTQLVQNSIPEFLNKQLNKVDPRPVSNVIFSTNSPRIIEEHIRTKPIEPLIAPIEEVRPLPRKFSQENMEIIEKINLGEVEETSTDTPPKTPPPIQSRYKKNEKTSRKSSVVSITPEPPKKPFLKNRSTSLDSLKNPPEDSSDKSSQDSLDKLDSKPLEEPEPIILRRKSLVKHKKDEEPELMKVFARRSLKLKDTEQDSVTESLDAMLEQNNKENQLTPPASPPKEPLIRNPSDEELVLRKTNNNIYPRSVSLTTSNHKEPMKKIQTSFKETRVVSSELEKVVSEEPCETIITEDFNQTKAKWEKIAQAQKKTLNN